MSTMSPLEELPFDEEMELHEDIGAELDYFILLTLLGIDNEAQEFASTALWPHLRHFPVLAEIANFFIVRNDIEGLGQLLDHVEKLNVQFHDPEEDLLLTYMRLIAVDQDAVAHAWYQGAADLINDFDGWTSETLVSLLWSSGIVPNGERNTFMQGSNQIEEQEEAGQRHVICSNPHIVHSA